MKISAPFLALLFGGVFSVAPASALCLKKPSESELKSVTVDQIRKLSRAGAGVYAEDVTIAEKKCTALKNTWSVVTPIGRFDCQATDMMDRPACVKVEGPPPAPGGKK